MVESGGQWVEAAGVELFIFGPKKLLELQSESKQLAEVDAYNPWRGSRIELMPSWQADQNGLVEFEITESVSFIYGRLENQIGMLQIEAELDLSPSETASFELYLFELEALQITARRANGKVAAHVPVYLKQRREFVGRTGREGVADLWMPKGEFREIAGARTLQGSHSILAVADLPLLGNPIATVKDLAKGNRQAEMKLPAFGSIIIRATEFPISSNLILRTAGKWVEATSLLIDGKTSWVFPFVPVRNEVEICISHGNSKHDWKAQKLLMRVPSPRQDGDVLTYDLSGKSTFFASGRLLSADGRPISKTNYQVIPINADGEAISPAHHSTTYADGSFEFVLFDQRQIWNQTEYLWIQAMSRRGLKQQAIAEFFISDFNFLAGAVHDFGKLTQEKPELLVSGKATIAGKVPFTGEGMAVTKSVPSSFGSGEYIRVPLSMTNFGTPEVIGADGNFRAWHTPAPFPSQFELDVKAPDLMPWKQTFFAGTSNLMVQLSSLCAVSFSYQTRLFPGSQLVLGLIDSSGKEFLAGPASTRFGGNDSFWDNHHRQSISKLLPGEYTFQARLDEAIMLATVRNIQVFEPNVEPETLQGLLFSEPNLVRLQLLQPDGSLLQGIDLLGRQNRLFRHTEQGMSISNRLIFEEDCIYVSAKDIKDEFWLRIEDFLPVPLKDVRANDQLQLTRELETIVVVESTLSLPTGWRFEFALELLDSEQQTPASLAEVNVYPAGGDRFLVQYPVAGQYSIQWILQSKDVDLKTEKYLRLVDNKLSLKPEDAGQEVQLRVPDRIIRDANERIADFEDRLND
ncbi:MAG: hypothetical protein HQ519_02950 [Planctomycetes bacterium]|nr:hypothetical protein [Planctomycetota bacterium]